MSTKPNPPAADPIPTPAWVNLAAVLGLVTFLVGGFFFLRHLLRPDEPIAVEATPSTARAGGNNINLANFGGATLQGRILDAEDAKDADEFRQLAIKDPLAAAATLARIVDSPLRDDRLYDLMVIWAEIDPLQAADWVANLPVGSLKSDSTAELGLAWAHKDPEGAARWVEENIFTENAPAGAASVVSVWAREDIDAASEWVESLDVETPARREAIKTLAERFGTIDPTRGLAWLAELESGDRNLVALHFVASWSTLDPEGASNWIRSSTNGIDRKTRDHATLAVIHGWTAADPESASAWILGIGDSRLKEEAKAAFAETHVTDSPPEALSWAQSIIDPERRLEVTRNVYEDWIIDNPEDFKTAMRDSWEGINEETRHEIYDLLLDHDPEFKKELFRMLDERPDP